VAEHTRCLAVLNVGRTTLRPPLDGFRQKDHVNEGQFVSPAVSLGTSVGSDALGIQVSVSVDWRSTVDVPGLNHFDLIPDVLRFEADDF
jgi:hypothetical protein